jgi:nitroreductase
MTNQYYVPIEARPDAIRRLPEVLLKAQIRRIAHTIDKRLQFSESKEIRIPDTLYQSLRDRLEVCRELHLESQPDMKWACDIMELCSAYRRHPAAFRYPWSGQTGIGISPEQFEKLIVSRRSIRSFVEKDIPTETIRSILTYAAWAPSNCNNQLVRFIVVKTPEVKDNINHDFSGKMGACIIAVVGDFRFYDDANVDGIYHDSAAAIQNMLLGCRVHDIGACYVADEGVNREAFRSILKVAEYEKITALVWMGYSDKVPIVPTRRDIGERIVFV